jgi:hypothetical protein
MVVFDQLDPLGELIVRWTGDHGQSTAATLPDQDGDEDKDYR